MSRPTCVSKGCSYLIHTDVSNNNGMHCCLMCMRMAGKHGPLCKKEVAPAVPEAVAVPEVVVAAVPEVVVAVPEVVISEVVAVPEVVVSEVAEVTPETSV